MDVLSGWNGARKDGKETPSVDVRSRGTGSVAEVVEEVVAPPA
jgi:hypothetical protein